MKHLTKSFLEMAESNTAIISIFCTGNLDFLPKNPNYLMIIKNVYSILPILQIFVSIVYSEFILRLFLKWVNIPGLTVHNDFRRLQLTNFYFTSIKVEEGKVFVKNIITSF